MRHPRRRHSDLPLQSWVPRPPKADAASRDGPPPKQSGDGPPPKQPASREAGWETTGYAPFALHDNNLRALRATRILMRGWMLGCGSNVIPRRARPGLAVLRPHIISMRASLEVRAPLQIWVPSPPKPDILAISVAVVFESLCTFSL